MNPMNRKLLAYCVVVVVVQSFIHNYNVIVRCHRKHCNGISNAEGENNDGAQFITDLLLDGKKQCNKKPDAASKL